MKDSKTQSNILVTILLALALLTSFVIVAAPAFASGSCYLGVHDYWDDAGQPYAVAQFRCSGMVAGETLSVRGYSSGSVITTAQVNTSGEASGSWRPPPGPNHVEFSAPSYWQEYRFTYNPQPALPPPTTTTTTLPAATTTTAAPVSTSTTTTSAPSANTPATTVPPVVTTTTHAPGGGSVGTPSTTTTTAAYSDNPVTAPANLTAMFQTAQESGYTIELDFVWSLVDYGTVLGTQGPTSDVMVVTITSGQFMDGGVPADPQTIDFTMSGFALTPVIVDGRPVTFYEVVRYGESIMGRNIIW